MKTQKYTIIKIGSIYASQRLDKFLTVWHSKESRSFWQKSIKLGDILINNRKIDPNYILRKNDKIKIFFTTCEKKTEKQSQGAMGKIIKIIYEDDNVIVLDKPAGVLSHRADSNKGYSVADFLEKRFPEIKTTEDKVRPGIVHRLDKDTSGIMITAKNTESLVFLRNQFRKRKVQKTYIALVHGNIKHKRGIIDLKIGRSKRKYDLQTVIDTPKKSDIKSRTAVTLYKMLKTFDQYTLLEVHPQTGRMHQIRVHLKAIGHPVAGDAKYSFRKFKGLDKTLDRQFLHASELKIKLPNRKSKLFKSGMPNELKKFLGKIE